ncbi:hypothetical protein [Arthrobacter sp. NPDC058192]|uniref:hypothetical protein n=1 Tax=Arthrobacter sp. NPDC058192 TaxID=3346372 RepID=UPI0036E25C33
MVSAANAGNRWSHTPRKPHVALAGLSPTHVFFTAWSRRPSEANNITVNAAMVRNVLDTTGPSGNLQHVGLVTGLKHYLGPFEAYGTGATRLTRVASSRHTDSDLNRPVECFTDMTRSRNAGFTGYADTLTAFATLFDTLRDERVIPA